MPKKSSVEEQQDNDPEDVHSESNETPDLKEHAADNEAEQAPGVDREATAPLVDSDDYESDENFDELSLDVLDQEENQLKQTEHERKIDIPLTPADLGVVKSESPSVQENKRRILVEKLKQVDMDSKILRQLYDRTMDAFRDKYAVLIDEVETLANIFEKYFKSFMQNNFENLHDKYTKNNELINQTYLNIIQQLLETGLHYNVRTKDFFEFLHNSVKSLRKMKQNFEESTIAMKDFSPQTQRMSLKLDCDLIPVIFVVYEHSIKLKACVQTLKEWLLFDQSYSKYLDNDLRMISDRKKSLVSLKANCEQTYNQLTSRKNSLKKAVDCYEKELELMYKKKEDKLNQMLGKLDDDDETLEEKKALLKMTRKKRAPKKYFKYQKLDCLSMLRSTEYDLGQLEAEFNRISDSIKASRTKNTFELIQDNTDQLRTFKIKLENLEYEVAHLYDEKRVTDKEVDLLENCCVKIKEIQMYKSCSQTLDKIFHNIKLPALKFGLPKNSLDQLIRINPRQSDSPVMLGTTHSGTSRVPF